jgi:hypothetical protein
LRCARWFVEHGALPEPGGTRDQQPGELARLTALYNIWRALWLYEHRGGMDFAKWVENHPSEWEIVQDVMEMENGGNC